MDSNRSIGSYTNTGQVIGRGSFATVYKGYRTSDTKVEVAIKAMYPEKIKQKQMLQEREVEVMRSLRHPNVVELLDVILRGDQGRAPTVYMVFEYCSGGDFSHYLRSQPGRKLSEAKAKHWMTHLKQGLEFLRSKNILHRDLKPQNLLLSSKDEQTAVLKLADFGFARFIHNQSLIETVCGTPLYMAPEILRSEKYSVRSDLWSVGCILFQSLVGRAPFVVRTHYELILKLESEPVSIPADAQAQLTPECVQLVMQLLTKEEARRIDWADFFGHPWFGGVGDAASASTHGVVDPDPSASPLLDNSVASLSQSNSPATRPSAGSMEAPFAPSAPQDDLSPGHIMEQHETAARLQRVNDRALAVLELADMKMDHGKPDEAAVLYWKGLQCIATASALIREDKENGVPTPLHDTLLERLHLKNRIYQERASRAITAKRLPASHARAPSELLYEFALQMGRDGGVSEILGHNSKADRLYANGAVILELLLSMAEDANDRAILVDTLQRFATRIAAVRTLIAEEEEAGNESE